MYDLYRVNNPRIIENFVVDDGDDGEDDIDVKDDNEVDDDVIFKDVLSFSSFLPMVSVEGLLLSCIIRSSSQIRTLSS